MPDANASDIDLDRFVEVAAQKVCAAKIPIAAGETYTGELRLVVLDRTTPYGHCSI
jgi:hypothetical protein